MTSSLPRRDTSTSWGSRTGTRRTVTADGDGGESALPFGLAHLAKRLLPCGDVVRTVHAHARPVQRSPWSCRSAPMVRACVAGLQPRLALACARRRRPTSPAYRPVRRTRSQRRVQPVDGQSRRAPAVRNRDSSLGEPDDGMRLLRTTDPRLRGEAHALRAEYVPRHSGRRDAHAGRVDYKAQRRLRMAACGRSRLRSSGAWAR